MDTRNPLPPETKAFRRVIWTGLITFIVGFLAVFVGLLWLLYGLAPNQFWSLHLLPNALHALEFAFIGGLFLAAACFAVLNRWHHHKGYYRCRFCGKPMRAGHTWCTCPESAELERKYRMLDESSE